LYFFIVVYLRQRLLDFVVPGCCGLAGVCFLLSFVLASVLFPLWMDDKIPNSAPYWLLSWTPFGICMNMCILIACVSNFIATRYWPCGISWIYNLVKKRCCQVACRPRNLPSCVRLCCDSPSSYEDDYIVLVFVKYLGWFPLAVLCIGLKLAAFRDFAVWRFVIMPLYVYWAWMIMDAVVMFLKLLKHDSCRKKTMTMFIIGVFAFIFAGFTISFGFISAKADGQEFLKNVPYSALFSGIFVSHLVFLFGMAFFKYFFGFFDKDECCYCYDCCEGMLEVLYGIGIFTLVCCFFFPFTATYILLCIKLDAVSAILYVYAFIPFSTIYGLIIFLVVGGVSCYFGCFGCIWLLEACRCNCRCLDRFMDDLFDCAEDCFCNCRWRCWRCCDDCCCC